MGRDRSSDMAQAACEPEMHPKQRYSRSLIEETISVWQPYYEKALTEEDAREIIDNMALFVGGLLGLRRDLPVRGDLSGD